MKQKKIRKLRTVVKFNTRIKVHKDKTKIISRKTKYKTDKV